MVIEILKDIFFVGYTDWSIRDFHSFETRRGVTYNSFLIRDEKNVIVDAVKGGFQKNLLKNIKEIIGLDKIDYIIVNHAEPDHAGALSHLLKECPKATIVCSQKGKEILAGYNDISSWKFTIVQTNDTLSIGKRTLEFILTPMVHWPDSMFTYLKEEKALFSMDAFGQHYSTSDKFDDRVDFCALMEEAKKYYANIIMPYGKQVEDVLAKVSQYEIDIILPAHGVIWKQYIKNILDAYKDWSHFSSKAKVLIIYDSMWQSTKMMAEEIYRGASKKNVEVQLIFVRATGLTEIVTEILDAAVLALGSANLNMGMMPKMGELLTYVKGLSPVNKYVALFGSFGWGKGAIEDMVDWVKSTKLQLLSKPIKANWRPTEKILRECYDLGNMLRDKAIVISKKQKNEVD